MHMFKSVGLAVALLLASAARVGAAEAPPAQMVTNAGHKLAFHVIAGHSPAIVLDAGGGLDSSYWAKLAPEIARRTGSEVVSYDRAGMGASEEVPGPWQVQAAVDDLAAVLKATGATHDLVLVSHSLAGELATYTAIRHPEWLRGVVLVDANVPPFFTDELVAQMYALQKPHVDALATQPSTPASRQMQQLMPSFVETSHAYHQAVFPKSVPVVVIVSEQTPFGPGPAGDLWKAAQAAFAAEAPNRKLVEAKGSSHDVAQDRPDVIVHAILDLIAR
jgi:pimeloyl-ACP methyl ester carboxylesterase